MTLDQITTIMAQADQYMDIVSSVLEDPALPQIATRIRTIKSLEAAKKVSSAAVKPGTPISSVKGLGLDKLVKPLDYYIYYRKKPWILPVTGIGAAGVLIGLGTLIGYLITK